MSDTALWVVPTNGQVNGHPAPRPVAPDPLPSLLGAIAEKRARVGVIGLGYVGLPLACNCAAKGFRVLGFDTDARKVAALQRGKSYVSHIPAATIAQHRQERRFEATDRFELLGTPDVLILCVPTPLTETREPDLHFLVTAARAVAARLRPGQLVVVESTVAPGTTRQEIQPLLEAGGLRAGTDFFLAFSPEREDPGNTQFAIGNIPKVVSGIGPRSLEAAIRLYEHLVAKVVPVSSPEVAEACKILENTYRAVNIALVNQLKVVFDRMGIDLWEVIEAAKTKPFGFQAFYPGPGWGGPCIPKDPLYLTHVARKYDVAVPFVDLASEVNRAMPDYVVAKTVAALNARGLPVRGSQIALLGMAYKNDVGDPRDSPGYPVLDRLLEMGARVTYNDPHLPRLPGTPRYPHIAPMDSRPLTEQYLGEQDCVLIITNHSAYDWSWVVEHCPLVIDTRNATRGVSHHRDRIVRA
jgi:UDP-N-acetyl-D-glucosamine dehydrogenase